MAPHCLVPPNFKVLLGGETKRNSGNFGDLSGWVPKASNPLSESLLLFGIYALGRICIRADPAVPNKRRAWAKKHQD